MHSHPARPGRRRLLVSAFVALGAALALAGPSTASASSVPTPTDPAAGAAQDGAPSSIPDGNNQPGDTIVHSWALTPGGNADPDASGNRPELSYSADPGTTITDEVTLYNYSTEQLLFRVYATDARNAPNGDFDLLTGDQRPTDVGSWVKVAQENITVPAGRQVTIPITIDVPAEATPGDHVGAIVASSPTIGTGENGQQVLVDRRTGTRLYLRVNGPVTTNLAVTGVETDYHHSLNPLGGRATVQFRVENRGNVRVGGTGTVEVSGPFGVGGNTVPIPDMPELLPGSSVTMVVDVPDVPALFVASTKVSITPDGDDVTEAVTATGSSSTFAPPISILLVLLAALFALLAVRRMQRHRAAARPTQEAVVSETKEPQHT